MNEEREEIFFRLKKALKILKEGLKPEIIPESGMTIAFAQENATDAEEVFGLPERITVSEEGMRFPSGIVTGADEEISAAILTVMKYDRSVRSAANIRYSEEITEAVLDYFPEAGSFDPDTRPLPALSMDWGVASCCFEDDIPDVIFNRESALREGRILVLGEDPVEIVRNIINLQRRINNKNQ
jgi:hydroxymethylpyrimidine/phosphomethylpyrimidine kinase